MRTLSNLLEQNLLFVFNQRDRKRRRTAIKELWAADGVLWSTEGTYVGHEAINRSAASFQRRYPEFEFGLLGETDEIPEAARRRWSFGTIGSLPAITGMDMIISSDGRIAAIYRFLDGAEL